MEETSNYLSDNLQQLINGCIQGHRSAQAELYQRYSRKMMGVCLWYAKNKEEAEEILQDGFIRVFNYIRTYSGEGSLEGWMRKIMVNAALLKYRNKKNQNLRVITEYNAETHDKIDEGSFFSSYDEKQLLKLVQSLSPVYRMVFTLYVFEGLKHREIAEQLGISEGTSKSNLADARAILQKKVYELQKTGA